MSESEPEHPKPGWRDWFSRFFAVWVAANVALFLLKVGMLWRPSHPEAVMFLLALIGAAVAATAIGYWFVREARRSPPLPEGLAHMGWADWLFHWTLVLFAVAFTIDWFFDLDLIPKRTR